MYLNYYIVIRKVEYLVDLMEYLKSFMKFGKINLILLRLLKSKIVTKFLEDITQLNGNLMVVVEILEVVLYSLLIMVVLKITF